MKLNRAEKSMLAGLMKDDKWDVLMKFVNGYIDEWNKVDNITGNTEFEFMREILTRKGKVEGLKEVLESLDRAVFE